MLDDKITSFDSVIESIDDFLCDSQPCGCRSDKEHLVEIYVVIVHKTQFLFDC